MTGWTYPLEPLGANINFRVIEVLIGHGRNGVDQERFVNPWQILYRIAVTPKSGAPSHTRRSTGPS